MEERTIKRRQLLAVSAAVLAAPMLRAQTGDAQKPIRLVVPYPPGGPLDLAARSLAEQVKSSLGTVVVENKPGAGGNIGVELVARAPADGNTLVIGAVATHAINPWLYAKLPFDPVKDFSPVALIAQVPNVLVLTPATADRLGARSLADLLRYLKSHPGRLTYASGGNGSGGHMAGELLKSMARVSIVHIPYSGAAPAQLGLLAGQTDLMFDNLASAAPQIRAGALRALAVTTRTRAASFPDLPTLAEAGGPDLAGFDISTWFGVFAPAGVPAANVTRLHEAFAAALATAPMRERLDRMGAQPASLNPQQFAAFVREELTKYQRVVRFSGARID
jgi:tripartite-type tricarboxylate transporter receptor subunit TctC